MCCGDTADKASKHGQTNCCLRGGLTVHSRTRWMLRNSTFRNPVNWAGTPKMQRCLFSIMHTYINYSCDLSFIYKLQDTSLFSPVAFIVFYIRTVLQDKTRVCWFSYSCECGITAAVFSRAFLATRKWNCCSSLQIICGDFQPADFLGGIDRTSNKCINLVIHQQTWKFGH